VGAEFCGHCGWRLPSNSQQSHFDVRDEKTISQILDLSSNLNFRSSGDYRSFIGTGSVLQKYSVESRGFGFEQKTEIDYDASDATGSEAYGFVAVQEHTTNKFYLAGSDFFAHLGSDILYQHYFDNGSSTNMDAPLVTLSAGIGSGKLVDIANYKRAKNIEALLLEHRLISSHFTRDVTSKIIRTLRGIGTTESKLKKIVRTLERSGILMVSEFNVDAYVQLQRVITDNIRSFVTGFEIKAGVAQDVVPPYDGYDLGTSFDASIVLSQQLGPRTLLEIRDDFLYSGEAYNVLQVSLMNYFSTTTDLRTIYRFEATDGETSHSAESRLSATVQGRLRLVLSAVAENGAAGYASDDDWALSLGLDLQYSVF